MFSLWRRFNRLPRASSSSAYLRFVSGLFANTIAGLGIAFLFRISSTLPAAQTRAVFLKFRLLANNLLSSDEDFMPKGHLPRHAEGYRRAKM